MEQVGSLMSRKNQRYTLVCLPALFHLSCSAGYRERGFPSCSGLCWRRNEKRDLTKKNVNCTNSHDCIWKQMSGSRAQFFPKFEKITHFLPTWQPFVESVENLLCIFLLHNALFTPSYHTPGHPIYILQEDGRPIPKPALEDVGYPKM